MKDQQKWEFALGSCYITIFTHPFALGAHFLFAPSESAYELCLNLGWIAIEVWL